MIEWKKSASGWEEFRCGEFLILAAHARQRTPPFSWVVELDDESSDVSILLASGDDAPTLDAAKSAAEQFAREWIAAQAAALSPGEWTSVLPDAPGGYWYRIPGPDDDSLNPDTWTDVRLKFFTRPALVVSLGCSIQYWSVPVAPPPLPEATDAK